VITDIFFGEVNLSARLPVIFLNEENDMNMTQSMYPGLNNILMYSEALHVGYRWYNAHNVVPAFAFGHGLSYTEFEYSNLKIQRRSVSFSVNNIGKADGAEVSQLYLGFPAFAEEPPKQLKGFKKIVLKAGENARVTFDLTDRDLSIWDVASAQHRWSLVPGEFDVMIGTSSEDIRLVGILSNSEVVAV